MRTVLVPFVLILVLVIPRGVQATNRVLSLDGTNDGVQVIAPSSVLNLGSAHSMTAWVRLNAIPDTDRSTIALKFAGEPDLIAYIFYYTKSTKRFGAGFGSGIEYPSGTVDLDQGWNHIAFTMGGGIGRWYINGRLSSVATNGSIGRVGTNSLFIGRRPLTDSNYGSFPGYIDELSLWDVALTSNTVTNAMAHGLTGSESGLKGYWNFDNGDAHDLTTNANNGMFLNNATTIVLDVALQLSPIGITNGRAYSISTEMDHFYQFQGRDTPFTNVWYGIGNVITGTGLTEYCLERGDGPVFFPARRWQIFTNTDSRSLRFDGTNDFAFAPHDASLNLTNGMTLEAWVKPSLTGGPRTLIAKASSPSIFCYSLGLNSSRKVLLRTSDSAGNIFLSVTGGTALATGQWRHVSASWNGTQGKILLDGVLDGSGSGVGTTRVSTISSFLVGGIFGSESFGGNLDQIRVWNIARTESDIQGDYQSILAGNEAGLVGLWRLSPGEGQTMLDSTPNGHDLTKGADPGEDTSDPLWAEESFPPASEYTTLYDLGESCLFLTHNCPSGGVYQLQSTTNLTSFNWTNCAPSKTSTIGRIEYGIRPGGVAELFRVMGPALP